MNAHRNSRIRNTHIVGIAVATVLVGVLAGLVWVFTGSSTAVAQSDAVRFETVFDFTLADGRNSSCSYEKDVIALRDATVVFPTGETHRMKAGDSERLRISDELANDLTVNETVHIAVVANGVNVADTNSLAPRCADDTPVVTSGSDCVDSADSSNSSSNVCTDNSSVNLVGGFVFDCDAAPNSGDPICDTPSTTIPAPTTTAPPAPPAPAAPTTTVTPSTPTTEAPTPTTVPAPSTPTTEAPTPSTTIAVPTTVIETPAPQTSTTMPAPTTTAPSPAVSTPTTAVDAPTTTVAPVTPTTVEPVDTTSRVVTVKAPESTTSTTAATTSDSLPRTGSSVLTLATVALVMVLAGVGAFAVSIGSKRRNVSV